MRIVFLLETASELWGGVKTALEDANDLADRGHEVTVLAKSPPPSWMRLRCAFHTVVDFAPENIPGADLVVATFWTTVQAAVASGKGAPVHYCQGFEADNPENAKQQREIEAVYALREAHKVTISPHLSAIVRDRFDQEPTEITYGVDLHTMYSPTPDGRPQESAPGLPKPVRVGLVGPYEVEWKDIPTGIEACRLAHAAGLDLELLRITNTEPQPAEQNLPFPVRYHRQVPPAQMGDLYRQMNVFLGTSSGHQEGFFMPAVEAMACGVPCVLTDVPCFRGYGEGQYALFVEPGNAVEMAEAMVIVAGHAEVRRQLVREGLELAKGYDRGQHVDQLERALGRLASPAADSAAVGTGSREMADSLRAIAETYASLGDHETAAAHLEAALCIAAEDAALHNDLGVLRHRLGDHAAARDCFEAALRLDPACGDARANLRQLAGPVP